MTINEDTKVIALHAAQSDIGSVSDRSGTQRLAKDSADWNRAALALADPSNSGSETVLPTVNFELSAPTARQIASTDWNALALSLASKRG